MNPNDSFLRKTVGSSVLFAIIGTILGYAILHPLSVIIVSLFEKRTFDGLAILSESFDPMHLSMGVYFALIGGLIGSLFAAYRYRALKTNHALSTLIGSLQIHNKALLDITKENIEDLFRLLEKSIPLERRKE